MRFRILTVCLVWGILCLNAGTVFAEQPTVQEINRLLERVEASGCRFVRNGTRYTGVEACAHIQKKYNHFKDKIKSAEDFVRLCATRSEMTGLPYQIICSGKEMPLADWLGNELADFRKKTEKSP